jgi:predicted secreted Zn-dependent protease
MLALLLLGCAHAPEPAPPVALEGATVTWFDLTGSDRIDLIESCAHDCPRDEAGIPVASLTTWKAGWSWTPRATDTCEIMDTTVEVDVSVDLPRWDPPADADPALVDEWRGYLVALSRHERGHIDLVHRMARDAEARIRAAGCDGADDVAAAFLDDVHAAEVAYDVETDNGRRQGADFWKLGGRAEMFADGLAE